MKDKEPLLMYSWMICMVQSADKKYVFQIQLSEECNVYELELFILFLQQRRRFKKILDAK